MLNLHIGIPGLFPRMLHLATVGMLNKEQPYLLPEKQYQEKFRSVINSKRKESEVDFNLRLEAQLAAVELSERGTLAISQHAMLGSMEDCFRKDKVLPYSEVRVSEVSRVFASVPITFHLTITNQFDYLRAAMERKGKGTTFSEESSVPSWASLVQRIKAAAPNRQIVVWDFERPERIALAFAISMLDTTDETLIEELHRRLSRSFKKKGSLMTSHEIPSMDHELNTRLDAQYDADLVAIKLMEGVSLVESESVPDEFHL